MSNNHGKRDELTILCPNGHMGFAPSKEGSFRIGAKTKPDYYCCDSGSNDIGPAPLGIDKSVSPYEWQVHDLEMMFLAAREQGVPMIIGSSGDTGANSRVDVYVDIIKKLALKHNIPKFKLGYFYSEVPVQRIVDSLEQGVEVEGLDGRASLTIEDAKATERIVAVAGIHPFVKLLEMGADVIIGGRSSDCAIFAAPAIHEGFSESLSYYLGKVMECASFCAEPYGAKETIIGTISHEDVKVKAMHPEQKCTVASVSAHAMYERSNPLYEHVAGGLLDMTGCEYTQHDAKTCAITGPEFIPIDGEIKVKLEGAGKIGERYLGIAGIRDPYLIENVDKVVDWAKSQVEEKFKGTEYQVFFHVYGKNGVMGDLEPSVKVNPHELCIIVEGIAATKELAEEVAMIGTRQLFYARLPDVKGTAGTAAFLVDEVFAVSPGYKWTLNHIIPVDDPLEFFTVEITEAGI